ncbi:MAG: hypothetical protein ACI9DG_000151 [Oleispira sp.]|jgi:hypothetical protein
MTTEQEIQQLRAEIKQLKFALLTVFKECSGSEPHELAKKIPMVKRSIIERGLNIDAVIDGTL